jgi:hypothetical protein
MAQTGEKYTEARRALIAGSGTGGGEPPGVTIRWPQDSLGWFTDQAYNAILLAADEARMLSHPRVDPEHLLLAAARRGNVERILAGQGIDARAIHDATAAIKGFGGQLELRPQRSPPASRCWITRSSSGAPTSSPPAAVKHRARGRSRPSSNAP